MRTRGSIGIALTGAMMVLGIIGCGTSSLQTATPPSMERLIAIIAASDPLSPMYNPKSQESESFVFAATELAKMGPAAAPAAPILARALRYPRRDSYVVANALAAMGTDAKSAVPELVIALQSERAEVRTCALFVLGIIGKPSSAVVPLIAPMLWDSDPYVRSAAAGALEEVTEVDLVDAPYELDPRHACSVFADEPNGSISGRARAWWMEEGQHSDWTGQDVP